jgi:hypothetical protein
MPVWIVDTPVNRLAAEQHWAQHPAQSYTEGVTTFKGNPAGTPEEWCVGELHTIDVDHGELSHVPPYRAIEAYGVVFNARLAAAFAEYGMREVTGTWRSVAPDSAAGRRDPEPLTRRGRCAASRSGASRRPPFAAAPSSWRDSPRGPP